MNASAIQDLQIIERKAEALASTPGSFHLDATTISKLQSAGYTPEEVASLVFRQPTIDNISASGELDSDASDRVYRLARIILIADKVFGDTSKAFVWLRRQNTNLGGNSPIGSLRTETGSRLVEELLIRIDHGIAA